MKNSFSTLPPVISTKQHAYTLETSLFVASEMNHYRIFLLQQMHLCSNDVYKL